MKWEPSGSFFGPFGRQQKLYLGSCPNNHCSNNQEFFFNCYLFIYFLLLRFGWEGSGIGFLHHLLDGEGIVLLVCLEVWKDWVSLFTYNLNTSKYCQKILKNIRCLMLISIKNQYTLIVIFLKIKINCYKRWKVKKDLLREMKVKRV